MKIVITGDSHVGALRRGADLLEAQGQIPDGVKVDVIPLGPGDAFLSEFFKAERDHLAITSPDCSRWLPRLPAVEDTGRSDVVYVISGPLHLQPLVLNDYFLKFPPAPLTEGRTKTSSALLRHLALKRKRYITEFSAKLVELKHRVLVVEPPRTFRHHRALETTPASTISYLEDFFRLTVKAHLQDKGIEVVELPAESYDAEGLMLDKYRHSHPDDQHHGNEAYGALMVSKTIEMTLGTSRQLAVAPP